MSNADKLFEELGYIKKIDTKLIKGSKLTTYSKKCNYTCITFRESKERCDNYWHINIMSSKEKQSTLNKTYKAIIMKCKELRLVR